MKITKQRVTCGDCSEVSDVELVTDAPIEVATASMRAARCAKCGGKNLLLGGERKGAAKSHEQTVEKRAYWWITNGEVGVSSKTIWTAMTGGRMRGADIPYDPDDFRRCKRLLEIIPEWRQQISKVAEVFPWWKPFSDAWEELDAMYEAEAKSGRAPKLYDRMKELEKESWAMRSRK